MNRAELKAAAKEQIKGNIGMLFLCGLIIAGISFACAIFPIAMILVTPPLSVGLCMVYLGLTEGKKAEVGTMFKGFQVFGKSIWLTILVAVFTFLWTLLFYIPGIIKTYSYSMAFYVLADNPEMTAREALRESKEIMKGHKWELFVLELSFILWMILGLFTLGFAYIYVIPYMSATVANFYQKIKRQPQVVEAPVEEVPVEEMI
ncbi:MAG: DUF975 family protein [Agathobacter sp.]|nr:DUF975 family protein [Agathobacter sp.]